MQVPALPRRLVLLASLPLVTVSGAQLSVVSRGGDGDTVMPVSSGADFLFLRQSSGVSVDDAGNVVFPTQAQLNPIFDDDDVIDAYARPQGGPTEPMTLGLWSDAGGHVEACVLAFEEQRGLVLRQETSDFLYRASTLRGLFYWDAGREERVTPGGSRANFPCLSGNGDVVAFTTDAPLLPDDTNSAPDVYVARRVGSSWRHSRASVAEDGTQAVGGSMPLFDPTPDLAEPRSRYGAPSLSVSAERGVQVAFVSDAQNLPGARAGNRYVYVSHVPEAGAPAVARVCNRLVPGHGSDPGPCDSPAITGDGALVAFVSDDPFLAVDLTSTNANGFTHVYIFTSEGQPVDAVRPALCLVDTNDAGEAANGQSLSPSCSADGRFVVFRSNAANLQENLETNGKSQVYVRDRVEARTFCVSSVDDIGADGDCFAPRISPSGRYVTFVSAAGNLSPESWHGYPQVYLCDRGALFMNSSPVALDARLSVQIGTPRTVSLRAVDSDSNPLHFFITQLPDPEKGLLYDGVDVTAPILSASEAEPYLLTASTVTYSPIDDTAHVASFRFAAKEAGAGFEAAPFSEAATVTLNVADLSDGILSLVSDRYTGETYEPDAQSTPPQPFDYATGRVGFSGDATRICFTSASALVPDDSNTVPDVYIYDRLEEGRQTFLVSTGSADANQAEDAAMSYCGRFIAFTAYGDIADADDNGVTDVYVADVTDPTNPGLQLVSAASDTGEALGDSHSPSVADGGRRIAFVRDGAVYVRPQDGEDLLLASKYANGTPSAAVCSQPAISGDGETVVFLSAADLTGENPAERTCVFAYHIPSDSTTQVSHPSLDADSDAPSVSYYGGLVAYVSASTWIAGDGRSVSNVYVYSMATGVTVLATDVPDLRYCRYAMLSADGRFVYFASNADLVSGGEGSPTLFHSYLLDRAAGVYHGISRTPGNATDGSSFRGTPVWTPAGDLIAAFSSNASNLTPLWDDTDDSDVFTNERGTVTNRPPVLVVPNSVETTLEDQSITWSLRATDQDRHDLRYVITEAPAHGKLYDGEPAGGRDVSTAVAADELPYVVTDLQRRLTYVPADDYANSLETADSFTLVVEDLLGASSQLVVSVVVDNVNDAPAWVQASVVPVYERVESRIDLREYVRDPDTMNPVPDQLSFLLSEEQAGLQIDGDYLVFTAGDAEGTDIRRIGLTVLDGTSDPVAGDIEVAVHDSIPLSLQQGWNLVSFPMSPEPSNPQLFFADQEDVPLYSGAIWFWDSAAQVYRRESSLRPFIGYWVFLPQTPQAPLAATGTAATDTIIQLQQGWNLLGPGGFGSRAAPKTVPFGQPLSAEDMWYWDGNAYGQPADGALLPGKGYWIQSHVSHRVDVGLTIE